jgi:hypothetical protein
VIGPVAGVAIIGVAVFFYLRSKKRLLAAPVQQVYYQGPHYGPAQAAQIAPKNAVSLGTSELANAQYRYGPTGAATDTQGFPVAEMPSARQAMSCRLEGRRDGAIDWNAAGLDEEGVMYSQA